MDDVLRQAVLTPGDVDLGAVDGVAGGVRRVIADRRGRRADRAEIGAGIWLGEVHRAGPRPVDQPGEEDGALALVSPPLQQFDGALRQHRVE